MGEAANWIPRLLTQSTPPRHPFSTVLRPSRTQILGGLILLAIVLSLLLFRYARILGWAR